MYLSAMSLWHDALYKLTFYLLTLPDNTFTCVVWSFIGSCYVRLLFFTKLLTTIWFSCWKCWMHWPPAWGTGACATLDFHLIFLITSEPHKLSLFHWTLYVRGCLPGQKSKIYRPVVLSSIVTAY